MSTSENIANQTQTTYEQYEKIKALVDIGYFLEDYVVTGGVVTKDVTLNNKINVTELVAALDNDVTQHDAVSFTTSVPNTTYYLDYKTDGSYSFGTAHTTGSYLPTAQVTTDINKNVLVITDTRGLVGGFRLSNTTIDAASIADKSVSNTEFQYLNGVTSLIQPQFGVLTQGLTGANTEIVNAKTRLDAVEIKAAENITSQRIPNNEIPSTKLKTSTDAEKIKLINLSDEVTQAMTGTAPVNSTPANASVTEEKLADASVTAKKLASNFVISPSKIFAFERVPNKSAYVDLFDKSKATLGGYYDYSTGNFVTDSNFYSSDFIPVTPGETLREFQYSGSGNYKTYWNSSRQFVVGNFNVDSNGDFAIPSNAGIVYMKTCTNAANSDSYQIKRLEAVYGLKSDYISDNFLLPALKCDAFDHVLNGNLFDKTKATSGGYYNYSDGAFVTNANYYYTELIPVMPGELLTEVNYDGSGNFKTYWDKNGQFVVGNYVVDVNGQFTVPGAVQIQYMRSLTINTKIDTYQIVRSSGEKTFLKPIHLPITSTAATNSKWNNKKANFLGDSITEGYGTTKVFHEFLRETLNLSVVRNYGIGGSTIADGQDPMHSRATAMDTDADLICVFGGTNDFANYDRPLGSLFTLDVNGNRIISTDTTTFYGALHQLCKNLILTYPGKQFVLFTPLHREVFAGQKTEFQKNNAGLFLEEYVEAVIKIGQWYSIPVCDLYSISGLQPNEPQNKALYFSPSDGLHPVAEGHRVMAEKTAGFLEQL